jgi:PST family polysaccharide transporter
MMYPIVRKVSGFRWTSENKRTGLLFFVLISAVFTSFYLLPVDVAMWIGVTVAVFSVIYSLRVLLKLVAIDAVPLPIRRLLIGSGLVPSGPGIV